MTGASSCVRLEWITAREAAEILGMHISAIPKMVRRGHLSPRDRRPRFSRADVEALRESRTARSASRAESRAPQPPDAEHVWLNANEAAR